MPYIGNRPCFLCVSAHALLATKAKGIHLEDENQKRTGDFAREIILFYSVLFFTCIVGIIELLPEFENIKGMFGLLSVSAIYFGFLFGAVFSMRRCFWIYEYGMKFSGKYGFRFRSIEPFIEKGKKIKESLTIAIPAVFVLLYLVKTGLLQ